MPCLPACLPRSFPVTMATSPVRNNMSTAKIARLSLYRGRTVERNEKLQVLSSVPWMKPWYRTNLPLPLSLSLSLSPIQRAMKKATSKCSPTENNWILATYWLLWNLLWGNVLPPGRFHRAPAPSPSTCVRFRQTADKHSSGTSRTDKRRVLSHESDRKGNLRR